MRKCKHGYRPGGSISPTYKSWVMMRSRCNNPRSDQYPNYGGRGICVEPEWNEYPKFLADMGERPTGTTLERIDTDGNYGPSNCRWATPKEQGNNRRNNRLLTLYGETKTVTQWAEVRGLSPMTIRSRLRVGWSVEQTLLRPAGPHLTREKRGNDYV